MNRIVLNESLPSGPVHARMPTGRMPTKFCQKFAVLLLEGKNADAEALVNTNFTAAKGPVQAARNASCYQGARQLALVPSTGQ